jgi:hypothetical protein
MNSVELAQELIDRAKQLKKFRIVREVPDTFAFRGRVPYDIAIKDEIMVITVHAVTLKEAQARVDEFLQEWS